MVPEVSWRGVSRLILGSKSWSRKTLLQQLHPPPFDVIVADIDEKAITADNPTDLVTRIAIAKARALLQRPAVTKQVPLPASPMPNSTTPPTTPPTTSTTATTGTGVAPTGSCNKKSKKKRNVTDATATDPDDLDSHHDSDEDDDDNDDDDSDDDDDEGRTLMICGDAVVVHKGVVLGKPKDKEQAVQFLRSYADAPVTTVSSIVVVDVRSRCYWAGVDEAEVYFRGLPDRVIHKLVDDGGALQSAGALRIENADVQPFVECIVGDMSAVMGFSQPLLASLVSSIMIDEMEGTKLA